MKLTERIYYYPEKGMLDCNTYIIQDEKTMIIDIGLDQNLSTLIADIKADGIDPENIDMICNTHLHMDHAWANQECKDKFKATIEIAPVQKEFYNVGVVDTSVFFNMKPIHFEEDSILDSRVKMGTIDIEVISTPGHSPESICFYCKEERALICGDLVFDRNIGRSDLPGGSWEEQKQSIETVSQYDIELLLPGHMGIINGKEKVKENFEFVINNIL